MNVIHWAGSPLDERFFYTGAEIPASCFPDPNKRVMEDEAPANGGNPYGDHADWDDVTFTEKNKSSKTVEDNDKKTVKDDDDH